MLNNDTDPKTNLNNFKYKFDCSVFAKINRKAYLNYAPKSSLKFQKS